MSKTKMVTVRVTAYHQTRGVDLAVNGRRRHIPLNIDTAIPADMLDALANSGATFETVGERPAAEASPESLLGSDRLPAIATMPDGSEVQLGTLVTRAHEESGLSVADWNALSDTVRDERIEEAYHAMCAEHPGNQALPGHRSGHPILALLDGTVEQVTAGLDGLTADELQALLDAEKAGKTRSTVTAAIDKAIAAATAA